MTDANALATQVLPFAQDTLMASLKASGAGFWGMLKEATSVANYIAHAPARFPGNEIIPPLMEGLKSRIHTDKYAPSGDLRLVDVNNLLSRIAEVNNVLADAGEAGGQVKVFLYEMAASVIAAAGTGLFGSGERVTAGEAQFMDALRQTLGLVNISTLEDTATSVNTEQPTSEAAPVDPDVTQADAAVTEE